MIEKHTLKLLTHLLVTLINFYQLTQYKQEYLTGVSADANIISTNPEYTNWANTYISNPLK